MMIFIPFVSILAAQGEARISKQPQLKAIKLNPVVELSFPQKVKLLASKGLKLNSLDTTAFSLKFDPMHLSDPNGDSYAYVYGGVMSTPKGWVGLSANNRDMLMLDIYTNSPKKSNYLIMFYGSTDDPLTLTVNGSMTFDVTKGPFVVPAVIQAGGFFEAVLQVVDKINKDKNVTNGIRIQKITIETVGT